MVCSSSPMFSLLVAEEVSCVGWGVVPLGAYQAPRLLVLFFFGVGIFFSSLRCYVVYSSVLLSWLTSRYYLDHRVERGGSLFVLLIFPDHLIGARWCLFVFLDPGSRVGLVYPRSCRLMHVSFLAPASFCCWCTSSYSRWPCFWKLLVEDSWLGGCTSVASIPCVR